MALSARSQLWKRDLSTHLALSAPLPQPPTHPRGLLVFTSYPGLGSGLWIAALLPQAFAQPRMEARMEKKDNYISQAS